MLQLQHVTCSVHTRRYVTKLRNKITVLGPVHTEGGARAAE